MERFNDNEITATLFECNCCGEIAQDADDMQHLGCAREHEYGKAGHAYVTLQAFQIQIVERADEAPLAVLRNGVLFEVQ